MATLSEIRGLIIDMDGVLWRGKQSLPGAAVLLQTLRRRSTPFALVTNNASASPASVRTKLLGMGMDVHHAEILGAAEATAAWLADRLARGTLVYVIGEDALRTALTQEGFRLAPGAEGVSSVIVGLDRQVNWHNLEEAALAIQAGALFVGTNPDLSLPTERGIAPGNGAILAALEATTGAKPVIIGKPEPHLFEQALARLGTPAEATLALGDRLETDILGGQRAGLPTALLLTGVTRREDLAHSSIKPDWVFEDLHGLLDALGEPQT